MYLEINKCITVLIFSNLSHDCPRHGSASGICMSGYITTIQRKELSPEVWHIPPKTPCIINIKYRFALSVRVFVVEF